LNVEQLKQALIVLEWRALLERFINCSINKWRSRLYAGCLALTQLVTQHHATFSSTLL